ncbi:MAG: rod shape-determining protein MreD [Microcystaceae cyanobacterium]
MKYLKALILSHPITLNRIIIIGSALLCLLLSLSRLPSTALLDIAPNWVLMWVVCWSLRRTISQGIIAGLTLGLTEDGLTGVYPSHIIPLVIVGMITATLTKRRYVHQAMISVVLIVFMMAIMAETFTAVQFVLKNSRPIGDIWQDYQRIALVSAILSSLWTPVLYYPLECWWNYLRKRQSLAGFKF